MRVRFVPPGSLAGLLARAASRGGFAEAITAEGALVARAPDRAALRALLRRLGVRLAEGRAPRASLALAEATAFRAAVWRACRDVPAGATLTYGRLAQKIGCRSARAVGGALAANPLAGVIPCHRVVGTDGHGGFAWGRERKRAWLRKEACGPA